ncbi:MAG: PTS system mannose/fructose/N-acetylgalactosamine-transporter subunit IIB [Gemmatimonadota bacterium]
MTIVLYRVDDRMIHGQVVLGWGRSLDVDFIVLVDDQIEASPWEQDLYRMAVPQDMEVVFAGVNSAAAHLAEWRADRRRGIVLTGDLRTMQALHDATHDMVTEVNVGGVHQRTGRTQRLPYVYLDQDDEDALRELEAAGVKVTAQDVPTAAPVDLKALIGT